MIRVLAAAACATLAFALDPDRAITQFVHTSWTEKDGAPIDARTLAQTLDGYLWIGTTAGLVRFDGVRFTAFEPSAGESFPSSRVRRLLATRDGALWIVWAVGQVSRLQNGHVTSYSEKDGLPTTTSLVESADGTIIAATVNGLSRFERGTWKAVAKEWDFPGKQARQLYFSKTGALWVATEDRVVYLPRGQRRFVDSGRTLGFFYNFAQAPDGAIWVSETGRSAHILGRERDATADTEVRVGASWVFFDRDGSLWVGSAGDGLRRVPRPDQVSGKSIAQFGPEAEQFTAKDGLSGTIVVAILEDREGNIWCATTKGLDRFRQGAFSPVDVSHPDLFRGILATKDGSLWSFSSNPLEPVRIGPSGAKEGIGTAFSVTGVCEDESGALWFLRLIAGHGVSVYRLRQGRVAPVPLPGDPGLKNLNAITCDHTGGVWLFDEQQGLFRLADGGLAKIADSSDPVYDFPNLHADSRGRVWLGQSDSIEMFDHGSKRRFGPRDGLTVRFIRAFAEDKDGDVWVAGEGALAKFDHDRFRSLSRSNTLPAQSVSGLVEDDDGYWWIASDAGVLRIRAEEMEHAVSDPDYRVHYELFNLLDGLPGRPAVQLLPLLGKASDGRVWVATPNGIAYVDPRRIPKNAVPPPVRVESMKVNGKEITPADGFTLPPGSSDLEIDYTALSLTIPERVRFKYKLEGHDSDWRDVGGRRQAYYGGLGPKHYRFRVIAANESGLWNDGGASFDFSITPAYYQTAWFRALMAAIALAILWGLYRYRLHQIAREFNLRLEERVGERTRIARELHDTLLQNFQGSLLEFQAARNLLQRRPDDAMHSLDGAISSAEAAIAEGRDAIVDLRAGSAVRSDLAELLTAAARELSEADASNGDGAAFHITQEGLPQTLLPVQQDEVYRMGREILRNAFRHSGAKQIEVEIRYGTRELRIRIRDNGTGIDPKVLERGARDGHWGLPGVRERAKLIGAQLDFWSEPGVGTEVQVSVPASVAYQRARKGAVSRWFRKMIGSHCG